MAPRLTGPRGPASVGGDVEVSISSYGKVWAIGHKGIEDLFAGPVVIQEKVDGSQFSFGFINGELCFRSKNQQIYQGQISTFSPAIDYICSVAGHLPRNHVFRGEFLAKPKHNTLKYDRIPRNHIALYDIVDLDHQTYATVKDLDYWAGVLELEAVQNFGLVKISSPEQLLSYLEKESALGGQLLEGVVCKRYDYFDQYSHPAKGKFVSEAFKETHTKEWKKDNPGRSDVLEQIVDAYRSPARWMKIVQHLRDDGKLENDPRDIGMILKAINVDILEECEEEIKEALFKWAWKTRISRGVTAGFPEWYKQLLLEGAFGDAG